MNVNAGQAYIDNIGFNQIGPLFGLLTQLCQSCLPFLLACTFWPPFVPEHAMRTLRRTNSPIVRQRSYRNKLRD